MGNFIFNPKNHDFFVSGLRAYRKRKWYVIRARWIGDNEKN